MDEIDREILSILQADARTPAAEIGRQVGLATSGAAKRIKRLEAAGVIRGYHAAVDAREMGLGLVAFLSVRTRERPGEIDAAEAMAELSEVQEVHHAAGDDCYLIKVRAADPQALADLIRNRVGSIQGVESTRTTVVLETVKETGAIPIFPAQGLSAGR